MQPSFLSGGRLTVSLAGKSRRQDSIPSCRSARFLKPRSVASGSAPAYRWGRFRGAIRLRASALEHRTLECLKCAHTETRIVACDPLKSDVTGWIESELRPPNQEIDDR